MTPRRLLIAFLLPIVIGLLANPIARADGFQVREVAV
jgi:hypothetical protein